MSLSPQSAAAAGTMLAPALAYSASRNDAPSPAPASTSTSNPSLFRRAVVSGVAATRRSPRWTSLGMPTFIEKPPTAKYRKPRRTAPACVSACVMRVACSVLARLHEQMHVSARDGAAAVVLPGLHVDGHHAAPVLGDQALRKRVDRFRRAQIGDGEVDGLRQDQGFGLHHHLE